MLKEKVFGHFSLCFFISVNNANPSMFVDDKEKATEEGTFRKKRDKKPFECSLWVKSLLFVCDKTN